MIIEQFWQWFSANCKEIDNDFLQSLDHRISLLGPYNWEVGAGKHKKHSLAISPAGDLDRLPETKEIINQAGVYDDWEFYYAKQVRDWEYSFVYETLNGNRINIDASQWQYVLLAYDDKKIEIILKAVALSST